MLNTRLAAYSVLYVRKSPTSKVRASAKAIKKAYADGVPFDLEVCDMSSPFDGSYTSPKELKEQGHTQVMIRFNADRDVMILDL